MSTYVKTEYAAIERHIRNARIERSVVLAGALASALEAVLGWFRRNEEAEQDRRALAADAFLRRAIQ